MDLVEIDSIQDERLLNSDEYVALFTFNGSLYWIIDWDEHFNLDYAKNINAAFEDANLLSHLPTGKSASEHKAQVLQRYRSGIPTLTADLFPHYRDGETAKVVTTQLLRRFFFAEDEGQYADLSREMEAELSFNTPMVEELVELRMRLSRRLPKFYINFDRKIFMHMVRGRFYEKALLDGWWGAEADFEHMIPTSQRYWVRSTEEDFWAVTNFAND